MGLRDRILTLFRLFLLFTVLLAVALVSAITTIRLTIHGHQETMPNLVGRSLESGQRLASGLSLELKVEGKVFNAQFPANSIVSQVPAAGTRIKMGQHVHVLVSLGQPEVQVPNVLGASARAAQITAIQDGLTVGDIATIHWPDADTDRVVAQEPAASSAELHSPALNVLVSLGPAPAAYECPNFLGQAVSEAQRLLQQHGFKVGTVSIVPTSGATSGNIIAQSPEPGSRVDADAEFKFQVAGPPVPAGQPAAPLQNPPVPATTTPLQKPQ